MNCGGWNVTSTATASDLVYDPYDHETIFDPHALFRRLRDEAPVYYRRGARLLRGL